MQIHLIVSFQGLKSFFFVNLINQFFSSFRVNGSCVLLSIKNDNRGLLCSYSKLITFVLGSDPKWRVNVPDSVTNGWNFQIKSQESSEANRTDDSRQRNGTEVKAKPFIIVAFVLCSSIDHFVQKLTSLFNVPFMFRSP